MYNVCLHFSVKIFLKLGLLILHCTTSAENYFLVEMSQKVGILESKKSRERQN